MSIVDLYIIAGGCGSRMHAELPKALVPITDEPCLTTTLQQIASKFHTVFVVTNALAQEPWRHYFGGLQAVHPELAKVIVDLSIRSGLGDGHATLQGLLAAERIRGNDLAQDIVVLWGDVFIPHAEIIDELLSTCVHGPGLFPAVREDKPYVSLIVNERMQCVSVNFSKYGEHQLNGFHDQSVFRFARPRLRASLCDLHNAFWKGGRYMTPGGELSLLYAAHYLYNAGDPVWVYETRYPTLSFNTVEEVAAIQQEISVRWRSRIQASRRVSVGV